MLEVVFSRAQWREKNDRNLFSSSKNKAVKTLEGRISLGQRTRNVKGILFGSAIITGMNTSTFRIFAPHLREPIIAENIFYYHYSTYPLRSSFPLLLDIIN
jgi:hypothetical protein